MTTRKRLKKYYILPLSIAGLAALAVTQYEYNKCKEKFFKDWYDYHKARNFTRFPEGSGKIHLLKPLDKHTISSLKTYAYIYVV